MNTAIPNHSQPIHRFTRLHQTSGTSSGRPLRWRDTLSDWAWLTQAWEDGLRRTRILTPPTDRVFFPFSFGPFLALALLELLLFEAPLRATLLGIVGLE